MATCTCPNCGKTLSVKDPNREFMFCSYCGAKIALTVHVNVNYSYTKREETSSYTEHIIDEAKLKAAQNADRVINLFAQPIEQRRAEKQRQKQQEEEQQRLEEEAASILAARQAQQRAQQQQAFRQKSEAFAEKCKQNPKQTLIAGAAILLVLVGSVAGITSAVRSGAAAASHKAELDQLKQEQIAASHLALGEALFPDVSTSGDYRVLAKTLRDAGFTNVTTEGAGDLILGWYETENDIIEVTVDGSPEFKKGVWLNIETPISIKYHSFARDAAQNKVDSAVSAARDAVNSSAAALNDSIQQASNSLAAYLEEQSSSSASSSSASDAASTGTSASGSILDDDDYIDDFIRLPQGIEYEACFVRHTGNYDLYYAVDETTSTVRYFTTNGDLGIQVGKFVSGDLESGLKVYFPYDGIGWYETLTYTSSAKDQISVSFNGEKYLYSATTCEQVHNVLSSADYFDMES